MLAAKASANDGFASRIGIIAAQLFLSPVALSVLVLVLVLVLVVLVAMLPFLSLSREASPLSLWL